MELPLPTELTPDDDTPMYPPSNKPLVCSYAYCKKVVAIALAFWNNELPYCSETHLARDEESHLYVQEAENAKKETVPATPNDNQHRVSRYVLLRDGSIDSPRSRRSPDEGKA